LPKRFEERIAEKFLYGDFQFSVDEKSPDFLQRGVFSCYEPISADEPIVAKKELRDDDWLDLLRLAYTDREKAFKRYSDYYLSTKMMRAFLHGPKNPMPVSFSICSRFIHRMASKRRRVRSAD